MDFEDSTQALFSEPNAYINQTNFKKPNQVSKVLFSEPYDVLPSYYLNEGFEKPKCDCVKKQGLKPQPKSTGFPFSFDFKSLAPILGLFGNGQGDFGSILSMLNKQGGSGGGANNIISSLMSNKDLMSSAMNLFKGGNILNGFKKSTKKHDVACTDFEIKNYTRV